MRHPLCDRCGYAHGPEAGCMSLYRAGVASWYAPYDWAEHVYWTGSTSEDRYDEESFPFHICRDAPSTSNAA